MEKKTLIGKWQFIGAEKHNGSEWKKTGYVKGMAWEFIPQNFSESKIMGNIIETTTVNRPIEMPFVYSKQDGLLKIDIFSDCTAGNEDKSEVDFYDVVFANVEPTDPPIIKISILTQECCPLPYLQYILQKIE